MAQITLGGNPIHTVGELPSTGSAAPDFRLVGHDMKPVTLSDFAGKRVALNIVPSVDTGVCATSARRFNEAAAALDDAAIVTVSVDLPFALGRFCAAEGIEAVVMASAFGSDFGQSYGAAITDGALPGLLSRAVVVLDAEHRVVYTEQVPEIGQEPDYDAALAALRR